MEDGNDSFQNPRSLTENSRHNLKPPSNFSRRIDSPEIKFVCAYCRTLLSQPRPAFPYLNASVCRDCSRLNPSLRIAESSVANKCSAPWTVQQVESLRRYQESDLLPYICDKGHVLKVETTGLSCRYCARFSLNWVYDWSARDGWT